MFKSNLKTINMISDNGVIFCFGIDQFDNEIFEGIVPPNPVNKFYYKCANTFHLDQYNKMFEKKSTGHVVFIDGNECIIYQYNGLWKRIKHFDALLIKRQRKGGQSSVRFSRLAEESRLHYITHIVDEINELITDSNSINYVFGGEELKNMFLNDDKLKPKFMTESLYHTFNKDTINEPYFLTLMNKLNNDDVDKITTQIIKYIDTEPEYLLFSFDEITYQLDNIEYILVVSDKLNNIDDLLPNKTIYNININNPMYGRLKGFDIIGKLFYKSDENVIILNDDDSDFI